MAQAAMIPSAKSIKCCLLYFLFILYITGSTFSEYPGHHEQENATLSSTTFITYVLSPGTGNIAVKIELPDTPRYPEGAPVVVEVSTWFTEFVGFHRVNDTRRIGAVTLSYLWPERVDPATGAQSEGEYDYGGPGSLRILRDVIRFACGDIPDINGDYINDLMQITPLTSNVGLFASSHSGVVATNVLAHHGTELPGVKYLVGRENPTMDEMYPLEIGYFDDQRRPVLNPFYDEDDYSPTTLTIDYSTVGWYDDGQSMPRPYFAAKDTIPEHILHPTISPRLFGKRAHSNAITQALLNNGALTLTNWPQDLATPAETQAHWPFRITVNNYPAIGAALPDLKVMLVFSRDDHVQAARTKPHIHQAWDGFHKTAGQWVRMNPDRAYAHSVNSDYGLNFPDNRAQDEPGDWIYIRDWGFPAGPGTRADIWLASVAEMADRVQENNWEVDLDSVFYPVLVESGETGVKADGNLSPPGFRLEQNYPNPFNPQTAIGYQLSAMGKVELRVINIRGQCVRTLVSEEKPPGKHIVIWDGKDDLGKSVISGLYFCRLVSDKRIQTQKMTLLR